MIDARQALLEAFSTAIPDGPGWIYTAEEMTDAMLAGLWVRGYKVAPLTRADVEQDYKDRIAAMGAHDMEPGQVLETKAGAVVVGLGVHDPDNVVRADFGRPEKDGAA